MSSSIWTLCAGGKRFRPLQGAPWRVVEAQHLVSTRKLVDTLEEQALLEELIDASKPPIRAGASLHVLLSTPFRYPPLKHGSRFGRRHEPSLWYGSESQRTLFAELAYYRLVFQAGTSAELGTLRTWHTAFNVRYKTSRGVDLERAPFDVHRAELASPSDYLATQALGSEMRAAGVEAFRFPSSRDARGGTNVGIFTPSVFGVARPRALETWHCTADRQRIELVRRDFFAERSFIFLREEFLVGGRLPAPAL
jgi:hypothetical protein